MHRTDHIRPSDKKAAQRAQEKWNSVAKPLHSLGMLEDTVIKIAAIFGRENFSLEKRCAAVMCADHGVTEECVTQTDSSVTAVVAKSVAEGSSNINLMADICNADVFAYDIGIGKKMDVKGLIDKKIAFGSENIAKGPAMTYAQAQAAICTGMDIVGELRESGYKIIITGEMGIGNTTASAAVAAALTGADPKLITGRGAGLDDDGLKRKIAAVERSLEINAPDPNDPVGVLAKVGGYDIGAMTGLFLGGAYYHIPIVADGFISAAAAALAVKLCPFAADYMLGSHTSAEPAASLLMEHIGLKAPINAGLRLGEGTGGVLLLPLIDAALAVYNSSHLFENLPMERYKEL